MWWLVFQTDKGVRVVIQPGPSLIHARMVAAIAGLEPGPFAEGHQLDAKTIRKIPKSHIGRCLSSKEAQQLLKRLA